MKIVIGGDFVPTESNKEFFKMGKLSRIIDTELLQMILEADYRIFNLEVPLTNIENPIRKCGPNLIAEEETINGILKFKPDLLGLANNHILDQGEAGLFRTQKLLKQNNIAYVGAGRNIQDAEKPYYFTLGHKRVGVYACAEHEYTIATQNFPGANPYEALFSFEHVKNMRANCDWIIVLYHGGKEFYRYPSPRLQSVCRKFAQCGANLIICQHSHCIGCKENYNNAEIIYGQGNFIFDRCSDEYWNSGLLIVVDVNENTNNWEICYVPMEKRNRKLFISNDEEILKGFYDRSKEIMKQGFVEDNYSQFCVNNIETYLRVFHGHNILQQLLLKLNINLNFPFRYSTNDLVAIRDYIECEAHQELVIEALKQIVNRK